MALVETQSQAAKISSHLAKSPEIRPFPSVVTRLLSALQEPKSTSSTFAKIVECDAALAARLLRMTNSPLYGLRNTVRSIEHACSMLGRRPLKTLSLSLAAASMYSGEGSADEERAMLWRHSLGCASTARLLAKQVPTVSPDDAFLAGIFHDVGKLVFYDVIPTEYANLTQANVGGELAKLERIRFAVTHEEVGMKSAHAWNLAEEIKVAIGYHHSPNDAPKHAEIATLVNLADALSRNWGIGSNQLAHLDVTECMEALNLDVELLPGLIEAARNTYRETARACA